MKQQLKWYLLLHLLLGVYSLSSVLSKLAGEQPAMGLRFLALYGGVLLLLGLYAVGWQQILKRLPLTVAYANKAVTVIWGILYGLVFFGEALTVRKVLGAVLIVAGVVWYVKADEEGSV